MIETEIAPYREEFKEKVLDLVISAWKPVFEKTVKDVPRFVYDNFWPEGWQARQVAEVSSLLDKNSGNVWLAFLGDSLAGLFSRSAPPFYRSLRSFPHSHSATVSQDRCAPFLFPASPPISVPQKQ